MIKRPLTFIGITYFITLWVLCTFQIKVSVLLLAAGAVSVIGFILYKHKTQAVLSVVLIGTMVAACFCYYSYEFLDYRRVQAFGTGEMHITGRICDLPEKDDGKTYIYVKTSEIDGVKVKTKIRLKVDHADGLSLSDEISGKARLYSLTDYASGIRNKYKSKNIYLTGYALEGNLSFTPGRKTFTSEILTFRQKIIDTVNDRFPNDIGGLIIGLILGDKTYISSQTMHDFGVCGILHVLAVSGMHSYYWTFMVTALAAFLTRSKRNGSVLAIVFMLFYMALTGFAPSVVRAGIMMIVVLSGNILYQKPDTMNSLGLACILLCTVSPFSVLNYGTTLSFASASGLALAAAPMNERVEAFLDRKHVVHFRRLISFILQTSILCIIASLFTFPIIVFYLSTFSLLSIAANILVVNLAVFTMISGGIGVVFLLVKPLSLLGYPVLFLSGIASSVILRIVHFLGQYEFMVVDVSSNVTKLFVMLVLFGVIVLAAFKVDIQKWKRVLALLSAAVFVVLLFGNSIYLNTVKRLYVADVGEGICMVLAYKGRGVIIDSGGDYNGYENLTDVLEQSDTKTIDAMIETAHGRKGNYFGQSLSRSYAVNTYVTNNEKLAQSVHIQQDGLFRKDNVRLELWGTTEVEYRHTASYTYAYINCEGTRILAVLDGRIKEEQLPDKYRNPDYFVTKDIEAYQTDFSGTKVYIVSSGKADAVPATVRAYQCTGTDGTVKITF